MGSVETLNAGMSPVSLVHGPAAPLYDGHMAAHTDVHVPPGTRRTVQKRSNDRQGAMTDAAARLLIDEGIDAITHRRVATAAGLPQGSATYYYPSRAALLAAAVAAAEDVRAVAAQALADALPTRTRSARSTARVLIEVLFAPHVDDSVVSARLDPMFTAMRDPELGRIMHASRPRLLAALSTVLDVSGFAHVDDVDLLAHFVDAALLTAASSGSPSVLRAAEGPVARLLERWR